VVKACLEERQGSEPGIDLSFFRLFPPFVEEKPSDRAFASWLPDVRRQVAGMAEWYDPSKGKSWNGRISLRYPELKVPGILFGRLEETLGPFQTQRSLLSQSSFFRNLRTAAMQRISSKRLDKPVAEHRAAFFNMVSGTRIFTQTQPGRTSSHEKLWEAVMSAETNGVATPLESVYRELEIVFERLHDRKLLLLSDGMVGLGLAEPRACDSVFVLRGCALPIVLRPER